MLLCEVRCSCGYSVSLRPLFFDGMALGEKGSQHRFVDWVCPHCGAGSRFNVAEVPEREFTSATDSYEIAVFHAFLRCAVKGCHAHATVHTLAENEHPRLPIENWQVTARCYEGHPVRVPLKLEGSTVTLG
jgi:hypothetical protein